MSNTIVLVKYTRYLFRAPEPEDNNTGVWRKASGTPAEAVYVDGIGYIDAAHASGGNAGIDNNLALALGVYSSEPSPDGLFDSDFYGDACYPVIATAPGTLATFWFDPYSGSAIQKYIYYSQLNDIKGSDPPAGYDFSYSDSYAVVIAAFESSNDAPDEMLNGPGNLPVFPSQGDGGGGDSGGGGGGSGGGSGGGTSGGGTSGGGTSGGGTSGGGTSGGGSGTGGGGGSGTSSGVGSGTSQGGGSAGSSSSEPVVEPINIPAGYTLWLKGGKIVVTQDNHPILCDSCPCDQGVLTCTATFSVEFDLPRPDGMVDDTCWYPINLPVTDEAISCEATVVHTTPSGGVIKNVQVIPRYTNAHTEHFYSHAIHSTVVGSAVTLVLTNTLKAYNLSPRGTTEFDVSVVYSLPKNEGHCDLEITGQTTTIGSYLSPTYYISTSDPYSPGGYYRMTVSGYYGWGHTHGEGVPNPELYAVAVTAGDSPQSGTLAHDMRYAPTSDSRQLGPHRPEWYQPYTPIAYNELGGGYEGVYRLDGNYQVSCTHSGYVGAYNVFIYTPLWETAFVATRQPQVGDTVMANWGTYSSGSSSYGEWHQFESVGVVTDLQALGSGEVVAHDMECRQCDTTRGGIQTPPEEFE